MWKCLFYLAYSYIHFEKTISNTSYVYKFYVFVSTQTNTKGARRLKNLSAVYTYDWQRVDD